MGLNIRIVASRLIQLRFSNGMSVVFSLLESWRTKGCIKAQSHFTNFSFRGKFSLVLSTRVELMTLTQKKCYGTSNLVHICRRYYCLQLLMHTFFCELFG